MTTLVGVIWRETPDRIPAHSQVTDFYRSLGYEIQHFDSGHNNFNRAASRNLAVAAGATVIGDADCIPEPSALGEAVRDVGASAVHLPYTSCITYYPNGEPAGQFDFTCGGTYVTTPQAWFAIGGQDERFTLHGPEDFAFRIAHETLLGPMRRHAGILHSLGHLRDPHHHEADDDPAILSLIHISEPTRPY